MAQPKRPARTPDDSTRQATDPADKASARGGDLSLERDPGDAVPPGVAPRPPPAPPAEEELKVREALERKLRKRSPER
jgi:hypothetical protein